ncbi:MAG: peptide deformylase [Synergistaceae bacterium]|nr:peptide deformylase [Synergistaceae bacterium]
MREEIAKETTTEKTRKEGLKIRIYPDPVLKMPTTPVERFDEELSSFVDEMHRAMALREGVGLAAPQVGVSKKIAVIDYHDVFYVLINPRLLEREGEQEGEEGCLSFPGIYAAVKRPGRVKVAAQDVTGAERVYDVDGYTARAFLHEMDHLEGKLFIEHLSMLKRGIIRKKMHKRAIGENE